MAGWHHWLDGRESGWTPGVGDGQGGLACCDLWVLKESDTTERLIWSDLILAHQRSRTTLGQKLLENILLMTLQLRAVFRPFQEIHRVLLCGWLWGGGWRGNLGFPRSSVGEDSTFSVGDPASIPGSGGSQGGRHGDPLKYSCLENPHGERSPAGYSPRGHKSWTQLSNSTTTTGRLQAGMGRRAEGPEGLGGEKRQWAWWATVHRVTILNLIFLLCKIAVATSLVFLLFLQHHPERVIFIHTAREYTFSFKMEFYSFYKCIL